MGLTAFSPKTRRVASAATAVLFVAGLVALIVFGIMLWRMYCEGFGCIGKGIAWFAWSAGYAAVLVLGVAARRTYRGTGARYIHIGLILQLVVGAALLAYWASQVAA